MVEQSEYPSQDELNQLQDAMKRVDESENRIEKVVQAAAVDREFYEDMLELYQQRMAQVATKDDFYPYTNLAGEFMLGTDLDGRPLGLTRRQLNEHMMIAGRTGAGKTTLFYNLIDTCNQRGLPVLVFDFKNDYRHVAGDLDLTVVNWRDFKFNPLQPPPGVRLERWAEIMADTWTHAMGLWKASRGYFLRKLDQLYWLYESEIEDGVYPSLFELRDLVRADDIPYASPRYRYKERLDNRLTGMTGFSGEIFDCSRGYPIEEFLDRNVVLELQEPVEDVQVFTVEAILTWIFYYRDAMAQWQGLRHIVMFDEAKQVFNIDREQDSDMPNPPVTKLMGKIREFGEGVIVADHEPSKLSDSLKANTNAKLWLSLGSGKDTEEMAETFGLDDDQTEYTRTLERGEGVLWVADADPVPVFLPDYHVEKSTTEVEIREQMEAVLRRFTWRERERPRYFLDAIGEWDREDEKELGEIAEALLTSVAEDPFMGMAERYDAIDVGSRQGTDAKDQLLELGLLDEVKVRTGTPGRNPKLLELTAQGRRALEARGYDVEREAAGVEHRWWQERIKEYYEDQGYDVEVEYSFGRHNIDVYAEGDDTVIAVEVARSPRHELTNIQKCLDIEVDRVQVAYLDDDVREAIEAQLFDEFGRIPDAVGFVACSAFS